MKIFSRVMKALADPNRVRVLKLLEERSLCVCEIQMLLGLAQPTVSNHLKILEDAGLVSKTRQGTWMIFRQATDSQCPYVLAMLVQLRSWLNDDPVLQTMLKQLPMAACLRMANQPPKIEAATQGPPLPA